MLLLFRHSPDLLQLVLGPVLLLPVQLLLQLPLPFLLHAASQSDSFPTNLINPIPDPCHLPSPPSSASLSPFCQLHYHQISYICDPAGILSRTEAELIDRRLQSISSPQAFSLNVTGCLCDLPPASSPHRRQCAVHPAWKDKKLRQIRVVVLIAPQANIRSIKKCAKSTTDKKQQNSGGGAEMAAQRHQRQAPSHGFTSATAQFVHDTLNRLLSGEHPRERCDPDLLLLQLPLPFLLHAASQSDSFPTNLINPIPDPCHLPSPPSSASLSPFCQLHYHQISYICDPAGILSRTEAELIDRRLQSISSPQAFSLNVTGCLCDLPPASSPHRRQCAVHPAWKDKKLRQIRVVVLIAPQANIRSIKKCAKSTTDKKQQNSGGAPSHGFTSATAQFVHDTLNRLLSGEHPRERCDPDLLIIYILGWSTSGGQMPFVGRMFRRNLAHLAHESQVERIHSAETSPFEVLSEQLTRAAQLIIPSLDGRPPGGPTVTVPPVSTEVLTQLGHHHQQFDPFSANPRTEQIPLWAILCSLALLSMALIAVLLAHWVGRRISAAHQVKKGALRMVNGTARGAESMRRGQEVGGVQKISTSTGHSVTFATGSGAGERERGGGADRSGAHRIKGSMMFRQFSRRHHRSRTDGTGAQQQKI
uniref:Uncharacterized protein n=1 Tax=Globodera pallida TaxID=36090 RepID=A0A183BHJ3_GLOPA